MERMNLHNHTTFSDGKYSGDEIVSEAIEHELKWVAITDHYRTSKVMSLDPHDIGVYISSMNKLKRKFKGEIKVLAGIEIDSSRDRTNFATVPWKELNKLDFVLFEYVQDDLWSGMPLWQLLKLRKNLKPPMGLAHNDIGRNFANTNISKMLHVLKSHNIFIELSSTLRNSKFNKPYYHFAEGFFRRVKGEILLSIGTDTHTEIKDVGDVSDAYHFIDKLGLQEDLITKTF